MTTRRDTSKHILPHVVHESLQEMRCYLQFAPMMWRSLFLCTLEARQTMMTLEVCVMMPPAVLAQGKEAWFGQINLNMLCSHLYFLYNLFKRFNFPQFHQSSTFEIKQLNVHLFNG